MKRKDITVIAIILGFIVIVGGVYLLSDKTKALSGGDILASNTPSITSEPLSTDEPGAESAVPKNTARNEVPVLEKADAYLSIQLGNVIYDPIPLLQDEDELVIERDGKKNVVALTRTSMQMHSSNCENQQCVHQGLVNLENRETRILSDMIICLPNEVVLRLLDQKEAQEQWDKVYGTAK